MLITIDRLRVLLLARVALLSSRSPQKRKKNTAKDKSGYRRWRTSARTKDYDQRYEETMIPERAAAVLAAFKAADDVDLPGKGEFYCVTCARHFIDQDNLDRHRASAQHRKYVRRMERERPHYQRDAEAAAGIGPIDNGPRRASAAAAAAASTEPAALLVSAV